MNSLSFPKSARIRKREEFLHLQRKSLLFFGKYLIFQWKKSSYTQARLGITVTKKYGSAVDRNRIKRLIREAFRAHAQHRISTVDMNVKPKGVAQNLSLREIMADFDLFISAANI